MADRIDTGKIISAALVKLAGKVASQTDRALSESIEEIASNRYDSDFTNVVDADASGALLACIMIDHNINKDEVSQDLLLTVLKYSRTIFKIGIVYGRYLSEHQPPIRSQ